MLPFFSLCCDGGMTKLWEDPIQESDPIQERQNVSHRSEHTDDQEINFSRTVSWEKKDYRDEAEITEEIPEEISTTNSSSNICLVSSGVSDDFGDHTIKSDEYYHNQEEDNYDSRDDCPSDCASSLSSSPWEEEEAAQFLHASPTMPA